MTEEGDGERRDLEREGACGWKVFGCFTAVRKKH